MGLYNAFFGMNPTAPFLLGFLKVTAKDFGRFRDAYVANGEIVVYTRCGGGNRAGYAGVFERMRRHPGFIRDADDKFDSTYCTFYFHIPKDKWHLFKEMDIGQWEPDKRWHKALAELNPTMED